MWYVESGVAVEIAARQKSKNVQILVIIAGTTRILSHLEWLL